MSEDGEVITFLNDWFNIGIRTLLYLPWNTILCMHIVMEINENIFSWLLLKVALNYYNGKWSCVTPKIANVQNNYLNGNCNFINK